LPFGKPEDRFEDVVLRAVDIRIGRGIEPEQQHGQDCEIGDAKANDYACNV
jgi:hypothetical protein